MKINLILHSIALTAVLFFAACQKDETKPAENNNPPQNETPKDSVTAKAVTYEASGSFSYTDSASGETKTYTHTLVKVNYKDQSQLWPNTFYTYISFYNTNSQAAAQMLTFVVLGKELPKTGTYKIGPMPIASAGIKEEDKLKTGEMAIMAVANGNVSKRNDAITINVVNENGKLTITSSEEINVYDNIMGELEGKCKNINLTKTTKKM